MPHGRPYRRVGPRTQDNFVKERACFDRLHISLESVIFNWPLIISVIWFKSSVSVRRQRILNKASVYTTRFV